MKGDKTINGTYGEVWLNNEYVAECKKIEAKVEFEKEDINVCGQLATDTKILSYKGTGSLTLYKVDSRMALLLSDMIKAGNHPRFTLLFRLKDPSAYGAERTLIKDVSFDDLTLMSSEAKTIGETEAPFTFTDWQLLDTITPRG